MPILGTNPDQFFDAISDTGVKGAVISPNGRVEGNIKKSEALLNQYPELKKSYMGENGQIASLPHLEFLIHTGFYTIPGTFKFKDVLVYSNRNFLNFNTNEIDEASALFAGNAGDVSLSDATDDASNFGYNNQDRTLVALGNVNQPNLFVKSKNSFDFLVKIFVFFNFFIFWFVLKFEFFREGSECTIQSKPFSLYLRSLTGKFHFLNFVLFEFFFFSLF